MQINGNNPVAGGAAQVNGRTQAEKAEKKSVGDDLKTSTENVKIARSYSAKALADKETPFDAEKVEKLKESIRNGSFTVNPSAIADAMIDSNVINSK